MAKLLHLESTFTYPAVFKARSTSCSVYCVARVFTIPEATLQSKKLIAYVFVRLPPAGEVMKYVTSIANELVVDTRIVTSTVTLFRSFIGDKNEVASSVESIFALSARVYGPH
jgi:hypothetical protein